MDFTIVFLLLSMFGLAVFMFCLVAGPKKIFKEGIDYGKIVHKDETTHYVVNGFVTPEKPQEKSFFERLADMDGLYNSEGRSADG